MPICREEPSWQNCSPGYTLVELLVVMALMLVLTALAVLIVPRINDEQRATKAATQLQQWIEIAKQRAVRDRAPRGVRLLAGKTAVLQVTDIVYLEQPDDYHLGATDDSAVTHAAQKLKIQSTATASAGASIVNFSNTNRLLTGGLTDPTLYPVQPGDYIELGTTGKVFKINSVNSGTQLTLTQSVPAAVTTKDYRIIRAPRPTGDDTLEMANNVIIDVQPRGLGYDLPDINKGPIDIMFAPDGRVIGNLASYDKIILWVRDVTFADGQGDPTLICIYPRTGLIAAHPVDVPNISSSPYTFTNTGRRSSE
jgi:prepilin-type N-terminal cleavage/methylation domain-containing protein